MAFNDHNHTIRIRLDRDGGFIVLDLSKHRELFVQSWKYWRKYSTVRLSLMYDERGRPCAFGNVVGIDDEAYWHLCKDVARREVEAEKYALIQFRKNIAEEQNGS